MDEDDVVIAACAAAIIASSSATTTRRVEKRDADFNSYNTYVEVVVDVRQKRCLF